MKNCLCEELNKFFDSFPQTHHKVGDIIIWPTEDPKGVYLLRKGFIRTYIFSSDGNEHSAQIHTDNSIFPITWAINNQQSQLYYECMTDVTVQMAPKSAFLNFIQNNNKALYCLLEKFSSQVSEMSRQIDIITDGNAKARVISILLYFVFLFDNQESPDSAKICRRFTHENIASFARISRERTTIELNNLVKKKLIKIEDHIIHIPSLKSLQSELSKNLK